MGATAKEVNGFIMISGLRVDWPTFFNVPIINGEEGRIGAKGMLKKGEDDAAIDFLKKAIQDCARANNKQIDPKTNLGKTLGRGRVCLMNADDGDNEKYEGHFTINMNTTRKTVSAKGVTPIEYSHDPCTVIGIDGKPYDNPAQKPLFYSGCHVTAKIQLWFQDSPNPAIGKRVNCTLYGVQFHSEGEPLSQGHVSEEAVVEGFGASSYVAATNQDWDEDDDSEESDDAFD